MGYFYDRIADAFRAIDKWASGEKLSEHAESDIRWFERTMELKKPFREYSKRSQRRFKQRFREGASSAKDVYRREYKERKERTEEAREEHGMSAAQWRTIRPLRDQIVALGVDVDPYMDDEVLKEFAVLYGAEYLRRVLTDQIDSTKRYLAGDAMPGRRRWEARGELESQFGASSYVMRISGTNPYYFYHGGRHR